MSEFVEESSDIELLERRSWPRRMLNRLEVDQAVFYALTIRAWQLLAGPVTLLLIASYFSASVQGYYYAFASLLGLQSFVELGLQGAIVYLASHEWAGLSLDEQGRIIGDRDALSRLVSLGRFAFRFFAFSAMAFVIVVAPVGYAFFSMRPEGGVHWVAPWISLVLLSGASIALIPCSALLRGCHQVATVNRFQTAQAITGNVAIWACIFYGMGLWSAVAVAAVKLLWDVAIAIVPFPRFFVPFRRRPEASQLPWRNEILPLQWKLALQGVFGYFASSIFTLVMFHYHGAGVAGQMGMVWTSALMTLQFSAIAWVATRAPLFGTLASRREFAELDRVFNRVTRVSFVLLALAGLVFVFFVWFCNFVAGWSNWPLPGPTMALIQTSAAHLANRLLDPLPTALLTLGVVLNHIPMSLSIYVRAHKDDPLIWWTTLSNVLVGLLVWALGRQYGPLGVAWGYLGIVALVSLPGSWFIFQRSRKAWQAGR